MILIKKYILCDLLQIISLADLVNFFNIMKIFHFIHRKTGSEASAHEIEELRTGIHTLHECSVASNISLNLHGDFFFHFGNRIFFFRI